MTKDPHIKEKVAEIIKLSDSGFSMRAAADKMDITIGQLAGIVGRNKIKFPRKTSKKASSWPKNKRLKGAGIDDAIPLNGTHGPHTGFRPDNELMENLLLGKTPRVKICAWPMGDPKKANYRTCLSQAMNGKPYCKEHCGDSYVNTPPIKVDRPFSSPR